ncbi:hypothetical protein DV736_g142, partial [Chaetothyriales sp. CBS 134916]
MDHSQELFEYTSGRWLYNESLRLSERSLVFNVSELKKTAAKCLHQPESEVKEFFKLAESGFNPSEVATLDLVRAHCVPVPKVLYYSADANNPVGAEFMIMEKLLEVVQTEAKLSKIDLPAYGSVYYERDLPNDVSRATISPIISPTPENEGLCIDSSTLQALSCVAAKELAWLKAFGRPRLPFERAYRDCMNYQKSRPEEHIESLEKYLRIAPYMVPQGARFHRPILCHPDLQPNNIFVSNNLDIVEIIDWQHCSVLSQFPAAGIPNYFQNYQDEESLQFIPPQLPKTLAEMDDEEQAEALEKYRRRYLHFFCLGFIQRLNPAHFEALDRRRNLLTRKTFTHTELMDDNGYDGKALPSCPISFTELDVQHTINVLQQQEDTDSQVENIQNAIGINADGWVSNEEYEGAVERAKLFKKQALESLDTEEEKEMTSKHWPFDDFDEEGDI